MKRPQFEFVEGAPGDLSFVARGSTPEEAFEAAAEALLAATVEAPQAVRATERRRIRLEEPDLELLLLRFLNELVYLRDAEQLLLRARNVCIRRDGEAALEADLCGERLEPIRHRPGSDVKAATAHGLRVTPVAQGWEAAATLDV
jgi:SHS2 domain-containing protein